MGTALAKLKLPPSHGMGTRAVSATQTQMWVGEERIIDGNTVIYIDGPVSVEELYGLLGELARVSRWTPEQVAEATKAGAQSWSLIPLDPC